jgi:hypothetical protein
VMTFSFHCIASAAQAGNLCNAAMQLRSYEGTLFPDRNEVCLCGLRLLVTIEPPFNAVFVSEDIGL